eukprot:1888577-Rhodomonas_salina.2
MRICTLIRSTATVLAGVGVSHFSSGWVDSPISGVERVLRRQRRGEICCHGYLVAMHRLARLEYEVVGWRSPSVGSIPD